MQRDNENADSDLLGNMIEALMSSAERPPQEVKGVDEEYIAALERVDIKKVKKDADCPICGNDFIDDPHPLLVRLPCHTTHVFDLECIRPWLLLNGTCPLDRIDLAQRERDRKKKHLESIKKNAAPEDDEEEWDGLYGWAAPDERLFEKYNTVAIIPNERRTASVLNLEEVLDMEFSYSLLAGSRLNRRSSRKGHVLSIEEAG
jgi:hypothetical protein